MNPSQEAIIRAKATEWFHSVERHLADLLRLVTHTRRSMLSFESEARRTFTRATMTFRAKYRDGNPLPDSAERVRLCGASRSREAIPSATGKPFRRWVQHLKGSPSRAEIFLFARDIGLLPLYTAFDDRKNFLNAARRALVLGRDSIEKRLNSLAEPRQWEAGDLPWPPPLLLTRGLPHTSIRALAAAWRYFLRVASVLHELGALADRHNADPPHKGLRLAFRTDEEHPFGRFFWTLNGISLRGLARSLARGKHPERIDEASLPDRLMRELGIPASARKAIAPHERHRRRMARIYATYVECLRALFSTGPRRIEEAHQFLLQAGFPELSSTHAHPPLVSDPV